MLLTSFLILGFGTFCWTLLVHDIYVDEMGYHSSCWLSFDANSAVFLTALGCTVLGALLSAHRAAPHTPRRGIAITAMLLNFAAPFIAYGATTYVVRRAEAAQAASRMNLEVSDTPVHR